MLVKRLLLATILAFAALPIQAAPATGADGGVAAETTPLDHLPALHGDYFAIDSQATARTYHVYVRLPEGYDSDPARQYPIVYLLDGDSLFPLLAPTHLFLTYDEHLPEAILVGIAYGGFDPAINKRDVDFTAQGDDTSAGAGGAPQFLAFLQDELLPEVERRHRADPSRRILLGQSRGGYFSLWSALQAPDLFWARIASNSAFSPAREQLFRTPATHQRNDLAVIIASGARDAGFRMQNALEWASHWQGRADAPWTIRHIVLPEGTHAASIGDAYRQSMLWLFRDEIEQARTARTSD